MSPSAPKFRTHRLWCLLVGQSNAFALPLAHLSVTQATIAPQPIFATPITRVVDARAVPHATILEPANCFLEKHAQDPRNATLPFVNLLEDAVRLLAIRRRRAVLWESARCAPVRHAI
jgi:hypothetical protein